MDIIYDSTYADKLRDIMDATKWRQVDLARVLGVKQKSVSYWLNHVKDPSKDNKKKIDHVYHRIVDDKLGKTKGIDDTMIAELRQLMEASDKSEVVRMMNLSHEVYYRGKGYIIEHEIDNVSRIYAFPSIGKNADKWYKVAGRSLLFYKYFLAPRLQRTVSIRPDSDNKMIFKHGIGSIKNGEFFVEQTRMLGYKVTVRESGVIVIELGHTFTKSEIKNMENQANEERAAVEKIIAPKHNYPNLVAAIRELAEYAPIKIKKMDGAYRSMLIDRLLNPVADLFSLYHRMANGVMEKSDAKKEMLRRVNDITGMLAFMDAAKLLELKARTRMGEDLLNIKKEIEDAL